VRTIRGLSAERNARAAVGTLGAHFRLPCRIRAALICIILIVRADAALAHSQDGEAGLQAGFMHPLTGPDHLLAMVAVGMVSVVLGGAAIWRVPAAFLAAMLTGAIAGYAGWRVAHVELGVASSVLLLGIALTLPSLVRWRHAVFGGVILFGLCHGHAHGLELPRSTAPLQYSFGFLAASLFLHVCGLFGAELMSGAPWQVRLRQSFGALMAAAGAWFVAATLAMQ